MRKYTYDYPMPAATVDLAVFALDGATVRVLMVRRKAEPFAGRWALPGGFVNIDEPFEAAARRELKEETGLDATGPLAFIGVYGAPGRDPRGRTITMAHATVVRGPLPDVEGGDDAAEAAWRTVVEAKGLAFDHDEIVAAARAWLVDGVTGGRVGLALLPERFRPQVKALHRAVFGVETGVGPWIERMVTSGLAREDGAGRFSASETSPARPVSYAYPFGTD